MKASEINTFQVFIRGGLAGGGREMGSDGGRERTLNSYKNDKSKASYKYAAIVISVSKTCR